MQVRLAVQFLGCVLVVGSMCIATTVMGPAEPSLAIGTCDDGNPCTNDATSPSGSCVHTNNTAPCDDGDACTVSDACGGGICLPGTPLDCNDGNPCTDDICDSITGCRHASNSAACNDGNACTTNDTCNGGTCVGGNTAAGCSACQGAATIAPQGGTFVGATSGSSTVAGSCGGNESPERIYRWTPASSGTATIQTCGTGTNYNSVVYLRRGSCTGTQIACNDDAPCAISGSSTKGSRITAAVTGGQAYYIVVDGRKGHKGAYSLTVVPPAICGNNVRDGSEECDGADNGGCVTRQCTASCTCVVPTRLPDLVPEISDVSFALGATVASGDVAEGCAEATSGVDLLRFSVRSRNLGTGDLFLGDPGCPSPCTDHPLEVCANPEFICSPAAGHNHAHYTNYARYDLLDRNGQAVVVGHKQGFCLRDTDCANPKYTCTNQGITAGCADLYGSTLGCQYLDITGVPAGDYTLRVTMDPFNRIAELNEGNNVASVPVTIGPPGSTACDRATAIPAAGGTFTATTTGVSTLSGSCGSSGTAPEKVFQWTPSASGTATIETCSTTATTYDTVLYIQQGSCGGAEIGCNDDTTGCGTTTDVTNPHRGSRLTRTVTAGQTYFIVVDGYSGQSGSFQLTVIPPAGTSTGTCASPTVLPASGGVFAGATSGASALSGSCVSTDTAPEKVFQWTPVTSGRATIETCSTTATTYDTVLYLRQASCTGGAQVACNDDTIGCGTTTDVTNPHRGSRLTPTVTAGQAYFIIVDGYGGQSGSFQLSVVPPP